MTRRVTMGALPWSCGSASCGAMRRSLDRTDRCRPQSPREGAIAQRRRVAPSRALSGHPYSARRPVLIAGPCPRPPAPSGFLIPEAYLCFNSGALVPHGVHRVW